ncbi:MAG: sugar phosphate isomerase/epimerase [Natronomonas sp.]|uniref:sugar phosphate isomerase/epimerase family protein n=1 Tax=Natronomonas sp. TaxID=2184060 RepID=UPI00286FB18D|nr:sugar phosphate isomerase/epimerase [Natronomonas sp.]MDR9431856.1 sugar phosphate isomerase/epimerase [Natronomonas sp.]
MVQTAIQFYTLRYVDEPLESLIERVGETSIDGVELAFKAAEADQDAVAAALDHTGVNVAGALVGYEQLDESLEATVEMADALDYADVGLSWLDPEYFETREAAEDTAALLTELADDLADHGIRFHYHNHNQEFIDVGGEPAYDVILDQAGDSVHFELDLGWALVGGADPNELLERLGPRAPLVHFKDTNAERGVPVEIGNGDVDFETCARTAADTGAEWFIYEHDLPDFPLRSLEHAADVLDGLRPV